MNHPSYHDHSENCDNKRMRHPANSRGPRYHGSVTVGEAASGAGLEVVGGAIISN